MARGHGEVSTSQAGHKRGTPRETSTASNIVAAMSAVELRLYSLVPAEICMEVLDCPTTSIVGEANNAIYFTREQFVAGLRFSIPLLVKQFLHFTRAPPALVHPNVFRILMGCSVLNSLYQHFAGGDLFYLHFEAGDRGLIVYVDPQHSCERHKVH